MKKFVFVLLLIAYLGSTAKEIPVGLKSSSIFTWSVWENDKGVLKHYLYVYNKNIKEVKLQIKQKKFKPNGEEMGGDKEVYKTAMAPSRITKLDYPTTSDKLSFLEFYENGKSVGLLEYNLEEPQRSFVDNKFKFYTNAGTDGSKTGIWVRYESAFNPVSDIVFTSLIKSPELNYLIKVINPSKEASDSYLGKLDSLKQTDAAILKLEQSNPTKVSKLSGDFGTEKFVFIPVIIEKIQNNKKTGEEKMLLPVFKE